MEDKLEMNLELIMILEGVVGVVPPKSHKTRRGNTEPCCFKKFSILIDVFQLIQNTGTLLNISFIVSYF